MLQGGSAGGCGGLSMPKPQYGRAHQVERLKWKRLVEAGQAWCCLCGAWLPPDALFDLDHEPGTDRYRGVACRACNRSEGAARGNRARGRSQGNVVSRWVL